MTATQTLPAKPAPSKSTLYALEIDVTCDLDKATAADLESFRGGCDDFAGRESELQSDWQQLSHDGYSMTVADLIARRDELAAGKRSLEGMLTELRWERFGLLPKLVLAFRRAAAAAEGYYEATLKSQLEYMASIGITTGAMPGFDTNPTAAEHQLRYRAQQELPVLSALEEKNTHAVNLRVLRAQIGIVPGADRCRIAWRPQSGIPEAVTRLLAGIDAPAAQPLATLPERRIAHDLGLGQAALLPEHAAIIENIVTACGSAAQTYHPLSHLIPVDLPAVRELVSQLPPTRELQAFLENTRRGMYQEI